MFWADSQYALGEFTHKEEEMTLERDLFGLGTLAVYCGLFRDKRGFPSIAQSAKDLLKGLQWSPSFKSLIEGLLYARPKSMLEVALSVREPAGLPSLDLSHILQRSPTSSLAEREGFKQDSARGDSAFRGLALQPEMENLILKTPAPSNRLQSIPAVTHRTAEVVQRVGEAQVRAETLQFKFSKGYPIPAELRDPDDIDYSRLIQPEKDAHPFTSPPLSLATPPKVSLDQSISLSSLSSLSFLPRNEEISQVEGHLDSFSEDYMSQIPM